METIIVWYNGMSMILNKFVADGRGIKEGYQIKTEAEFWEILAANSEYSLTALRAITGASKN